ncbi:hypothetical protein CMV_006980 [Castanea mollissima]|uniref:BSD domain-containing protein n=1 Tax=Castanea mollissima TaxID=60419 RepID=A0A8J4VQN5_9ROSI|nr:hypothetical protein CMV_006980 [Castanea mollissima]
MSEACFWKIYFVLLHPRLNKHDAEVLSTPQEFVSKKKKVQTVKLYRENLLAEVQFLRKRHRHLLKLQSPKGKADLYNNRIQI